MGDEEWFADLYQACYLRLVLSAYALTNDLGEAEETAQKAFAMAYARRAMLADSPEAWVRIVAVNLARRRRRRRAMVDRILRRHPTGPEPPTGEHLDPHEAIRALAHQQRAVVVLRCLADLSLDEVSSILDIPVGTAKFRLARARAAIPELDDRLAGLRDALQERVHQPELREVTERYRQRNGRRRKLGAVAAVVVIGAAVPLLRTPLEPAAPDEAPATTAASYPDLPPGLFESDVSSPFVYELDFADATHGFGLRGRCIPYPPRTTCTDELVVTTDGRRWLARPLPTANDPPIEGLASQLFVLGPSKVVVETVRGSSKTRWFSADAGQTWQRVTDTAEQSVAVIPDGGVLRAECGLVEDCKKPSLTVMVPDTGRDAPLANQPELGRLRVGALPVNGTWWVSGTTRTGDYAVALSRNAGHTWSIKDLPKLPSEPPILGIDLSIGPHGLYATVVGQLPDVKNGLLAILRSTNDGRTWEVIWRAANGNQPRSIGGLAIATGDGRLIINAELGAPYVSTDNGKTFRQATPASPGGWVRWTRAGYLVNSTVPSTVYRLSADGVRWKDIVIG